MAKTKSIKLSIKPELIEWAISTSGWKKEELSKSAGIPENNLSKGEITLKQLESLANKTKRPLASFFLSKVPHEDPKPKDYRMLPEKKDSFDKKTVLSIRKARYLQEISKELAINIDSKINLKTKKTTLQDNPETVALELRNTLDLTIEKQKKFKDGYQLYNYLREKLEDLNVFSFQISMPIEDARGFALADRKPEIIVVNSKDEIYPRIFTLIHELGHLLLGETAISLADIRNQDKVEKWCNTFAASFLLPSHELKEIYAENKDNIYSGSTLTRISNKFKVSKSMLVYNLSEKKYISKQDYKNFLDKSYEKERFPQKKGGGGAVAQDKTIANALGNKFISLVADNFDKEKITTSDALSYLSVKSKNLDKVLSRAKR